MERIDAVIRDAEVHKIYDLFSRKPAGLGFNETEALVVIGRTEDGRLVQDTFYLGLKADGTFDPHPMGRDAVKYRRHRLASFLEYYKMTDDVSNYKLREGLKDWIGKHVEVVQVDEDLAIYVP